MAHVIESASSGRAKCRGCDERIAAGVLRFGERLPNPFAEGEMTHWFHLDCAAFKRPEPFLETLQARGEPLEDSERLEAEARRGIPHPRPAPGNRAARGASPRGAGRSFQKTEQEGGPPP